MANKDNTSFNLIKFAKLFKDYDNLNQKEIELLYEMYKNFCSNYYGIKEKISLKFEILDRKTLGVYRYNEHIILININLKKNIIKKYFLDTLAHEMAHAYDFENNITESSPKDLFIEDNFKNLNIKFNHYIYAKQSCEIYARQQAYGLCCSFKQLIQNTLNSENLSEEEIFNLQNLLKYCNASIKFNEKGTKVFAQNANKIDKIAEKIKRRNKKIYKYLSDDLQDNTITEEGKYIVEDIVLQMMNPLLLDKEILTDIYDYILLNKDYDLSGYMYVIPNSSLSYINIDKNEFFNIFLENNEMPEFCDFALNDKSIRSLYEYQLSYTKQYFSKNSNDQLLKASLVDTLNQAISFYNEDKTFLTEVKNQLKQTLTKIFKEYGSTLNTSFIDKYFETYSIDKSLNYDLCRDFIYNSEKLQDNQNKTKSFKKLTNTKEQEFEK